MKRPLSSAVGLVLFLVAVGCEKKPTGPAAPPPAPAQPTPPRTMNSTPSAAPSKPARAVDPYEINWRKDLEGAQNEECQEKAKAAIAQLEKMGLRPREGYESCDIELSASAAAGDGSIKPEILEQLRLAGITQLSIRNEFPLSDAGMMQLGALRCLSELHIHCEKVTDAGLLGLKPLASLHHLNFTAYEGKPRLALTGAGFKHLEGLSKLRIFWVRNGSIDDAGLSAIGRIPGLTTLWLDNNRITDAGLAGLKPLQKLKYLVLDQNAVTGTGFQQLGGLKELESVSLRKCPITDEGVASISSLPIQSLLLYAAKITDKSATDLAKMKSLKSLRLSATSITDSSIEKLASLPALEELEITETKVTDACLPKLATFPKLKRVALATGPMLTKEGVDKLKKAKAGLEVADYGN